jgi:hypothetical protein
MKLVTKNGAPLKKSNADPKKSQHLKVYLYKTFGGRIEIRIAKCKQDKETRLWKVLGKPTIFHSTASAVEYLNKFLVSWER